MPGKGAPKIVFRCPQETIDWLNGRVAWSRANRRDGEHTLTSLILELIEEGRKKRERSRTWRKKKRERQQQQAQREAGA